MALSGQEIMKRFDALDSRRGEWLGRWQTCADYVLPRLGQWNQKNWKIFDSTAPQALGRFAAALEGTLTPRTQKWHDLVTGFEQMDSRQDVAQYLEMVRNILFKHRYAPEANFAEQMVEAYLSLGVYGTAVIYVDDAPGLRYQCIPVHEIYLAENANGRVDTVFRAYSLTARQAFQEFGEALPENILSDAQDSARMENEHQFIHGVFPRQDYDPRIKTGQHMPIASFHVARSDRKVVRESGYRTMPYAVSRFTVAPGEIYGRSPAMEVLPAIINTNEMKKTLIRCGQVIVDPPLLLPEEDILSAFNFKPGSLVYGGVNSQGTQMVVPLQMGGNLPAGLEMIQAEQKTINDSFYITLFQILVDAPEMTATEVVARQQEKAQLLAPVMGRQQSEMLRVIIERELDILESEGKIPEAPEELEVQPKYTTPLAVALESRDGTAILQAFQGLAGLAQASPEIIDLINFDAAGQAIWASFGAPADGLRTEEEVAELRQQRAEQQQQEMMMQQAAMAVQGLEATAGAEEKLQRARALEQGVVGSA